jgi:hypothetical protein
MEVTRTRRIKAIYSFATRRLPATAYHPDAAWAAKVQGRGVLYSRFVLRNSLRRHHRETHVRHSSVQGGIGFMNYEMNYENENGVPGSGGNGLRHEQVAEEAYRLWQERGCPMGSPDEDWYRAELEIAFHAATLSASKEPEPEFSEAAA